MMGLYNEELIEGIPLTVFTVIDLGFFLQISGNEKLKEYRLVDYGSLGHTKRGFSWLAFLRKGIEHVLQMIWASVKQQFISLLFMNDRQ